MKSKTSKAILVLLITLSLLLGSFGTAFATDDFKQLGSRKLSIGARGHDVVELQTILKEKGFFKYKKATGYFGPITKKAVFAYQKATKGLYPYGVADFATIRALKKELKKPLKIAMLIPGKINDGGFMEAGYNGLLKIKNELGAEITYIDQVKPELELLVDALRELAETKPDMIIAHGGQNSAATKQVAEEFPKIKFVVVQGNVTGKNLSSYEVLQEESAWLAGAAAGLLTKTNVVGHMSGIRVTPGLKGRGAFANGLKYTNPEAKFLTNFSGNQDDNALSRKIAEAEIEAGADIIFTMLNAGRQGAIEAMREHKVYQIGNVVDWYPVAPDVFIASAVANVSMAAFEAAKDLAEGKWKPGVVVKIGLENPNAVRLALSPDVPEEVVEKIEELAKKIINKEIKVEVTYDGPEFEVE